MKNTLRLMTGVSLLCLAALAGCSNGKKDGDKLYVCVYDGGYGTAWIDALADAYQAKTGTEVVWEADQSVLERLEDQLENGSDYDIYMSHGINWQNYAARGLLADLTSLYSSTVEGTGKTFAQRLCQGAEALSKSEGADGVERYYKACFTQGAGGLIYNMDMFEANHWTVPTTYAELVSLCNTIVDADLPVEGKPGSTVAPISWSGADRQYYWDYPVFEWWAELAGLNKINSILDYRGSDGKIRSGYQVFDPNGGYKEFLEAYDMWYDLIAMTSANSVTNSYSNTLATASSAFANGESAMITYAQWAKYEIENTIKGDLSFDIAMMKTPKANSTCQYLNYEVGFGDSMIVPENSSNQELAMDFMNFMATYDGCKTFVEKAEGAFLAFDYSDVDISSLTANDPYIDSVYKKITECTSFNLVSTNPITYWNVNSVMPWPGNNYYYQSACSKPASYTAALVGEKVYSTASQNWSTWCDNAGIGPNE